MSEYIDTTPQVQSLTIGQTIYFSDSEYLSAEKSSYRTLHGVRLAWSTELDPGEAVAAMIDVSQAYDRQLPRGYYHKAGMDGRIRGNRETVVLQVGADSDVIDAVALWRKGIELQWSKPALQWVGATVLVAEMAVDIGRPRCVSRAEIGALLLATATPEVQKHAPAAIDRLTLK